jgi:hypothetical protein
VSVELPDVRVAVRRAVISLFVVSVKYIALSVPSGVGGFEQFSYRLRTGYQPAMQEFSRLIVLVATALCASMCLPVTSMVTSFRIVLWTVQQRNKGLKDSRRNWEQWCGFSDNCWKNINSNLY